MAVRVFDVDDLGRLGPEWDAAVAATPGADPFCASSDWSFAAARAFGRFGAPTILGDGRAFCGLRPTETAEGEPALVGLDPLWGFATPCVGHPARAAAMLALALEGTEHAVAVVAGQRRDGHLTAEIARRLEPTHDLFVGPSETRLLVDLSGGVDAWFARRSGRFRQRIRRIGRDADAAGLELVDVSAADPAEVMSRILAIEAASWKGARDTGLAAEDLAEFYRIMLVGLARGERLRSMLARTQDRDVGYILGAVRGDRYRGLQLGFADDHRHLGLGHLLQYRQLRRLELEGVATYDLGMDIDYKRRWADTEDTTISVVAVSR